MKSLKFFLLLASCLLSFSCEAIFTTSFAGVLKRPSVALPANLSANDALVLVEEAKASGDTNLINALIPVLTDLSDAASGQERIDLIVQAGELSIEASGLSQALTDVLAVFSSGSTLTQEEQLAAIATVLSTVELSADLIEAMSNFADIDPADAGGTNLAFAGIALIIDATNGGNLAALTPEELIALQTDPGFIAGQTLLASAITQMAVEGVDPGFLGSIMPMPTP